MSEVNIGKVHIGHGNVDSCISSKHDAISYQQSAVLGLLSGRHCIHYVGKRDNDLGVYTIWYGPAEAFDGIDANSAS